MKISVNDISKVIHAYVRQQVVPKLPNSPLQFFLGLGNNYLINLGINNILNQYIPQYYLMLKTLGIIDEQDYIDLDKLYENSLNALDDCTGHSISFDIFDGKRYTVDKGDIEEIYKIAQRYGFSSEPARQQ